MKLLVLMILSLFVGFQSWATSAKVASASLAIEKRNLTSAVLRTPLSCERHVNKGQLNSFVRAATEAWADHDSEPASVATITPAGDRQRVVLTFQLDANMNQITHVLIQVQTQGTLADPASSSWTIADSSNCTRASEDTSDAQP